MKRKKNYIKEMHLYSGKLVNLLRDVIWCFTWIGGVWALHGADDQAVLANAYFIFSAPLLLDFVIKIYSVKKWPIRIFYVIWAGILFSILAISFAMFLNVGFSRTTLVYRLSVSILLFIIFDFIVGLLTIEVNDGPFDDKKIEFVKHDSEPKDVMDIFSKNLLEGGLGSIEYSVEKEGDQ